jgi:hypothetical protein
VISSLNIRLFDGKMRGMDHLEDRHRWNDNIKIEIKEMLCKSTNTNMVMA